MAPPIPAVRVELLPLAVDQAEELAPALDDVALHTFIGGAPLSLPDLRARYARLAAGSPDPAVVWLNWAIRLRATGRLVGTVQATVHLGEPAPSAELAWVVGTAWQRQGLATEAARAVATWLTASGVPRLLAHVHPDHAGSARVARAVGLAPTPRSVDGEVEWVSDPEPPA